MSNDIRTALDIIKDENEILISTFVKMKEKVLHTLANITSCTMDKTCIKCRCLWCSEELSWLPIKETLHIKLHNDCYYKVLKEWIP